MRLPTFPLDFSTVEKQGEHFAVFSLLRRMKALLFLARALKGRKRETLTSESKERARATHGCKRPPFLYSNVTQSRGEWKQKKKAHFSVQHRKQLLRLALLIRFLFGGAMCDECP